MWYSLFSCIIAETTNTEENIYTVLINVNQRAILIRVIILFYMCHIPVNSCCLMIESLKHLRNVESGPSQTTAVPANSESTFFYMQHHLKNRELNRQIRNWNRLSEVYSFRYHLHLKISETKIQIITTVFLKIYNLIIVVYFAKIFSNINKRYWKKMSNLKKNPLIRTKKNLKLYP